MLNAVINLFLSQESLSEKDDIVNPFGDLPNQIEVHIKNATKLHKPNTASKIKFNPYIAVYLTGKKHSRQKTKAPLWSLQENQNYDETLTFPYNGEPLVVIQAFDADMIRDEFIGEVPLDLLTIINSTARSWTGEVTLFGQKGTVPRGNVTLTLTMKGGSPYDPHRPAMTRAEAEGRPSDSFGFRSDTVMNNRTPLIKPLATSKGKYGKDKEFYAPKGGTTAPPGPAYGVQYEPAGPPRGYPPAEVSPAHPRGWMGGPRPPYSPQRSREPPGPQTGPGFRPPAGYGQRPPPPMAGYGQMPPGPPPGAYGQMPPHYGPGQGALGQMPPHQGPGYGHFPPPQGPGYGRMPQGYDQAAPPPKFREPPAVAPSALDSGFKTLLKPLQGRSLSAKSKQTQDPSRLAVPAKAPRKLTDDDDLNLTASIS